MPIELTCPKCGSRVRHMVLTCYPPINDYRCESCDYRKQVREEIVKIKAPL